MEKQAGRPRGQEAKRNLNIRIDNETYERLAKIADSKSRTPNAQALVMVKRQINNDYTMI